ncbi:hypothetical protein BUALT_Bualt03G0129500 [Buddleja alternifolia]|uniref:Uncharacterized protein n=1 Tax=Buddleja alternifolia TaxID=168488 RepID=A0AAV6Y051_9LAMI|nr:hypothetical protein BUALT_Bualt03G0129500 [Buddleja alternifolia]
MGYPQVNKSDKQTEESPDSSKVHIEVEPGDVTGKEVEGEPLPYFDPTESDEDQHSEEHDQLIDYSLTRDREKRIVKAPSREMSSGARGGSLIVAASIGAVEALKDQLGVCRWNYALRSIQQRAKTSVQSILPPKSSSSSASGMVGNRMIRESEKIKRAEKAMKKVMDLSSWGPSTVRF